MRQFYILKENEDFIVGISDFTGRIQLTKDDNLITAAKNFFYNTRQEFQYKNTQYKLHSKSDYLNGFIKISLYKENDLVYNNFLPMVLLEGGLVRAFFIWATTVAGFIILLSTLIPLIKGTELANLVPILFLLVALPITFKVADKINSYFYVKYVQKCKNEIITNQCRLKPNVGG